MYRRDFEQVMTEEEIQKILSENETSLNFSGGKEESPSESARTEQKERLSIISAVDLQAANLPPTAFLVDKILPAGTSILSAASKIGKSWMVLDMALCIASGEPFMGYQTKKCGVLYLALEDSQARLQSRMNKILAGRKAPAGFDFATEACSLDEGLLKLLGNYFDTHSNAKLVIIDTLQKIRGKALPREDAYAQDYREMGAVKSFLDKRGLSVLFVHHNRKLRDDADPFNMISGTNGIMGAADTIWTIVKSSRTKGEATLYVTGRDVEQLETVVEFDKGKFRWKVMGTLEAVTAQRERQEYEQNTVVAAIRAILQRQTKWSGSAGELMEEGRRLIGCNISPTCQSLSRELSRIDCQLLEIDGIVHRTSKNGTGGKKHYLHYQDSSELFPSWISEADKAEEVQQVV